MHDELIKALRCCRYGDSGCEECPFAENDKYGLCANLISYAADAIEELQAQIPQWISVDDRLPDVDRPVFVNCNLDGKHYRYMITCWTGIKNHGIADWENVGWALTVSHWMPLPELPKGISE